MITLNMAGNCQEESKIECRSTQQLCVQLYKHDGKFFNIDGALPASQKASPKRSKHTKASVNSAPACCQHVAQSDDLEEITGNLDIHDPWMCTAQQKLT